MKRCVINVAVGGWYPRGQKRLAESVKQFGAGVDFIGWNTWPPGSPPHAQQPYAFKSYAFQEAARLGYETILWLDASCWAIRPLGPLFDHIETEGHVFSFEARSAGQWLKDSALPTLGVTRDEAMNMPLLGGMFMGICLKNERSQKWLQRWTEVCQDGKTLPGAHYNVNKCVSTDPRVLGHTHDQSVASIIAFQLGMAITPRPKWRDLVNPNPDPSTVILACGL